jgi:hypothetical protein
LIPKKISVEPALMEEIAVEEIMWLRCPGFGGLLKLLTPFTSAIPS